MLTKFVPTDWVAFYHASPYKKRIDLIGRRLIEQRYLPAVTAEHVREWLRFTTYLQRSGLALPCDSREADVQAYVVQRLRACGRRQLSWPVALTHRKRYR
jgi:hypothetical protein